jgi:general stress protein 26
VDREALLEFMRAHKLAVVATVGPDGKPEAALVGYAVSDELELVFDTTVDSRKLHNIRANPEVAAVIGWDAEQTLQYEGAADEPTGEARGICQLRYFDAYPDGRERAKQPDITYVRVRPSWLRYSDYAQDPPLIVELEEPVR